MSSFEQGTHSFILRIWWEPREFENEKPEWRISIEHVASGERQYCKNTEEIITFLIPYFQQMDAEPKNSYRLWPWAWWRKRLKRKNAELDNR